MSKEQQYKLRDGLPVKVSEPAILYAVRQNTVDSTYLGDLKDISGLTDELLSDSLNLNVKTFRSYKARSVSIKPYLQEHVISLLALYNHGVAVFGSKASFNDWLMKANYYFDNDLPVNFLTTVSGIRYIDDRLTAIEYGDNA
ncbi:MAG: MbcA/ParS/Xre antitoxin family protein [Bacteroidota bacterium]